MAIPGYNLMFVCGVDELHAWKLAAIIIIHI